MRLKILWLNALDQAKGLLKTYIRVSPDLLDGLIVEVTGVTGEETTNLVGVLQAAKDLIGEGELATLPQLKLPSLLAGAVNRVQPDMVVGGTLLVHVLLELDDVFIGDHLSVGRRQDRGSITVNGAGSKSRNNGSRGTGRKGKGEGSDASHYDGRGSCDDETNTTVAIRNGAGLPAT